jgi:phosphoribosylformimino-5-aminoimidazole carboxamide ribotide isomerase
LFFTRFFCTLQKISEFFVLLIIPAIEIKDGKCLRTVQGAEGPMATNDPIEMAKLWRKENAKSLHVTDMDGYQSGTIVNGEVIREMVKSVDIPIELGGSLRKVEDVQSAIGMGMYRVTVNPSMIADEKLLRQCVEMFGASKIVLGIVIPATGKDAAERDALETVARAKAAGIKRVLYTDIVHEGPAKHPNYDTIKTLGERTGMRITVSGGVSGLDDLLKLQELEPAGVDSVVIGRAMYENKFSCQGIWRMSEAGNYPYTAKV